MKVKLNSFRAGARPGDVVDVSDSDAATLIEHGAAFPVEDTETEAADEGQEQADQQVDDAQTVSGSATLTAASGTDTAAP